MVYKTTAPIKVHKHPSFFLVHTHPYTHTHTPSHYATYLFTRTRHTHLNSIIHPSIIYIGPIVFNKFVIHLFYVIL